MLSKYTNRRIALSPFAPIIAALIVVFPFDAFAQPVLSFEAENASQTSGSGWSTESELAGFNGSGYIVWRGSNDFRVTDDQPPAGIQGYDFEITEAGTYEFVARVQARVGNGSAPNDQDNDAWVMFTSGSATSDVAGDSAKWTKFFISGANEVWGNYSRGEQFDPDLRTDIKRDLPVGTHRVLIGGRSTRFAIDSVELELVQSLNPDTPIVGAPIVEPPEEPVTPVMPPEEPVTPVVTPPEEPITPVVVTPPEEPVTHPSCDTPIQEPEPPVASCSACTAEGATLRIARRNYANACPTIPREDCDPLSDGTWICSSEDIDSSITLDPMEPDDGNGP